VLWIGSEVHQGVVRHAHRADPVQHPFHIGGGSRRKRGESLGVEDAPQVLGRRPVGEIQPLAAAAASTACCFSACAASIARAAASFPLLAAAGAASSINPTIATKIRRMKIIPNGNSVRRYGADGLKAYV